MWTVDDLSIRLMGLFLLINCVCVCVCEFVLKAELYRVKERQRESPTCLFARAGRGRSQKPRSFFIWVSHMGTQSQTLRPSKHLCSWGHALENSVCVCVEGVGE